MDPNLISVIWVGLIILFTVVEAITLGLTSIWFAIGALGALLTSALGFAFHWQVVAFLVVSVVMMIYTRPIVKDFLKVGRNKTNVDAVIGERGMVVKIIQPGETGQVKVKGQIWTAKGISDNLWFDLNERVEVVAVEGVKVIVKRAEDAQLS